jgi:hypothetical protein
MLFARVIRVVVLGKFFEERRREPLIQRDRGDHSPNTGYRQRSTAIA